MIAAFVGMGCFWPIRSKKRVSKDVLKMKQPMETSEASQSSKSFCNICMDTKAQSKMFSNGTVCGHLFCLDCIRTYVKLKIKQNIAEVKCPDPECKEVIRPALCSTIIPKKLLERWGDALCESSILGNQKFYCPFKDCSAMLVDDSGVTVTLSECPHCHRLFCAQCKVAWHSGMDCRKFKSLKKDVRNPDTIDTMLTELAKKKRWRRCPNCNIFVEKQSGCNHISCRCGHYFCYNCGKKGTSGNHTCQSCLS